MDKHTKPLPRVTPDNQPFWDACRRHELLVQHCAACDATFLPPAPLCPHCLELDPGWRVASGRGQVTTFVEIHQNWFPAFADDLPYNVAQIQLDEGPRLTANLVDVQAADIEVGMPVEVVFDDVEPDFTLPRFRPVRT
ncbi:MAG: Zn-ribbon domain-containing OB-fold protein [Pseudomonadota bacterium]